MKVLLCPPTHHYKDSYPSFLSVSDFPTGFAYLAASLKQAGHEVIGLNPNNIIGYPSAKLMLQDVLIKKIRETKPDFIAFGGLCTDYKFLRDAIEFTRIIDPSIPIIMGGQIVTNDYEFIYNDLKPNYAIIGEADHAIVDIVNEPPEPGILKAAIIEDLDSLPFPDYEPFGVTEMLDKYSICTRLLYRYSRPYPRPFVIVASRSCPFGCTFCVHGHRNIPYRARSISNIMAEIKQNYERYKFNILIIDDELFAVNKERMIEFCNAVLEGRKTYGWDFDWMFQTHASARLDLDTLKLARSAGCNLFSYGLESASPTVIKSMNKKIKIEQVIEAIKLAKEANIGFSANLIFGDVAETTDTWAESLTFWLEHCRESFVFLVNVMPYPGSKIFDDLHSKGFARDKKRYYETIDDGLTNITQIPMETYGGLAKLLGQLERGPNETYDWMFAKPALNVTYEVEKERDHVLTLTDEVMVKFKAACPHCKKEIVYRQPFKPKALEYFKNKKGCTMLGAGCTHCNRRIKITS